MLDAELGFKFNYCSYKRFQLGAIRLTRWKGVFGSSFFPVTELFLSVVSALPELSTFFPSWQRPGYSVFFACEGRMIKTNHIVSHLPPTAFIFLRTETIVFSQEKSYGTLFLLIVLGQSPWKFVTVGNFPGFQPFSLLIVFLFFSIILFPFALAIFNLACFCLYLSKRLFPWSYRIAAIKVGGKTRYIRFCFVTFHTLWLVQKKLSLPSHPSGSEAHTRKAPNHFVASCSLWLLSR